MLTLRDDFERFQTSMEEVTADMVKTAGELELEVEPEDMIELLQSHKSSMHEQRKEFLVMEKTVKML